MSQSVDELHFEVMTSAAHVIVVGGRRGAAERARLRVEDLEGRWTRFAPSEVTALNARSGEVVALSPDTYTLVEASVTAWRATNGRFDPTVLDALVALGYDRSFDEVRAAGGELPDADVEPAPAPGLHGAMLWPEQREVLLPAGSHIDPGGIGKGLAADLVVAELRSEGCAGALVNLGGDTRATGEAPSGGPWSITIENPRRPGRAFARVALRDGGLATSSTLNRRWRAGGADRHHVVDPSTGSPTAGDAVAVTAVAGLCWWAEATTKRLLVEGSVGLTAMVEASAMVFCADGSWVASPELEDSILR